MASVRLLVSTWSSQRTAAFAPNPAFVQYKVHGANYGAVFRLNDTFAVEPAMARDWQSIVDQCQTDAQAGTQATVFPDGGVGALRTFVPGATAAATDTSNLRLAQADQTYLAASAVPNTSPAGSTATSFVVVDPTSIPIRIGCVILRTTP